MKKHLLLTTLSVCSFSALFAQPISKNLSANSSSAFRADRVHSHNNAGRTTSGNASRCIARAVYDSVGIVTDSFTYSYSGAHGSYPDGMPWKYDNGMDYSNSTGTYVNAQTVAQTFDANSNIIGPLTQNWVSGSWVNSSQSTFTYDGMNNQLSDLQQTWNTGTSAWHNSQSTLTYDGMNNELSDSQQTWNTAAAAWKNQSKTVSTYASGTHNLTSSTYMVWDTAAAAWKNNAMYISNYDGLNNLVLSIEFTWNATTTNWDTSNKGVYTYDGANDNTSTTTLLWTSPGVWDSVQMTIDSGFVNHFATKEVYLQKNNSLLPFHNFWEVFWQFNSYGQITYDYTETWNSTAGLWQATSNDFAERLYYELYASVVPGVNPIVGNAIVYPVPAKNTLSLDITWDQAQPFTIYLYDMQGRVLRSWQETATAHFKNDLSVNDVPAGNYILKIQGDKGSITDQVTVVN